MRFYLDEMFAPRLAKIWRSRDIDAVSALELGNVRTPDEAHLQIAAGGDRCVVSKNYDDFELLTLKFHRENRPHAGVLLVSRRLKNEDFGALAAAIQHFDRNHPDGLEPYTLLWLVPAPG
jgi:predicted nuclease of predicted toxin-antitoxin system